MRNRLDKNNFEITFVCENVNSWISLIYSLFKFCCHPSQQSVLNIENPAKDCNPRVKLCNLTRVNRGGAWGVEVHASEERIFYHDSSSLRLLVLISQLASVWRRDKVSRWILLRLCVGLETHYMKNLL